MATNNSINLKSSGIASYDGAGTFTALANPLTVSNGGTGVSSTTAYAVLCGGTTSTGVLQSIASVGNSGQLLTSNGAGALPTFQNAATTNGYCLQAVMITASSLADATTYFWANGTALNGFTSSGAATTRLYIPQAGTVNKCYGSFSGTGGSSTATSLYLRLNNTTDYTISTTLNFSSFPVNFSATTLGITVSAGDYLEFKLVTPTWPTNPSSVTVAAQVYVE